VAPISLDTIPPNLRALRAFPVRTLSFTSCVRPARTKFSPNLDDLCDPNGKNSSTRFREALLLMKLPSYRLEDRVHIFDMIARSLG
jgi:hypothetical protein